MKSVSDNTSANSLAIRMGSAAPSGNVMSVHLLPPVQQLFICTRSCRLSKHQSRSPPVERISEELVTVALWFRVRIAICEKDRHF
jgi:hypothetical protein